MADRNENRTTSRVHAIWARLGVSIPEDEENPLQAPRYAELLAIRATRTDEREGTATIYEVSMILDKDGDNEQ